VGKLRWCRNPRSKSNKYVGVIHFEGSKINLLPKISFDTTKIRDLGWENKYSSFEAITHSISSMNLELTGVTK
jgi:hypothetical protein